MRRFIHCSTTLYLGFVIAGLAAAGLHLIVQIRLI